MPEDPVKLAPEYSPVKSIQKGIGPAIGVALGAAAAAFLGALDVESVQQMAGELGLPVIFAGLVPVLINWLKHRNK